MGESLEWFSCFTALQPELGLPYSNTHNNDSKTFPRYRQVGVKEERKEVTSRMLSKKEESSAFECGRFYRLFPSTPFFKFFLPGLFLLEAGGPQFSNAARGSHVDTVLANAWEDICGEGFPFPQWKTKSLRGRRSFLLPAGQGAAVIIEPWCHSLKLEQQNRGPHVWWHQGTHP